MFNALKIYRLELAKAGGVPAYAVFPDKTLAEIARLRPSTRDAFAGIHGVGKAKLQKFSKSFLAEIERFLDSGTPG